jgi:Zn-dependent protease
MGMYSWWPLVGVLLMIFAGKSVLLHILLFNKIRSFRLSAPSSRPIPRDATPPATAAVLRSVEPDLEALGFKFDQAVNYVPQEGEAFELPAWIYINSESRVFAMVRKLQLKTGIVPRPSFESLLADGRYLITSADFTRSNATEVQLENPVQEVPIEEQYRAHLDFIRQNAGDRQSLLLSPEDLASEKERIWNESMRLRTGLGQVYPVADGRFAYTVREAARRTVAALAKVRVLNRNKGLRATVQKLEASGCVIPAVEEEIEDYRKHTKASELSKAGAMTKLLMLVISMALFVFAFRLSLSWTTLLILLGVLTFHEGGHLLGMRIFGYKNLQMLYLPFLGAVAIGGKRENVKPWQELVVLFLGPVPGFVLGLCVLMSPFFERLPARHELGLILLVLNLFNMLPIHPLDGGQIWDILLFRRFPFARVVFLGLSAVALLAAGVIGVFGLAFVALGVGLLLRLGNQITEAKIIRSLKKELGAPLSRHDEETLLEAIFASLRKQSAKLKTFSRMAFVRGVLAQCKADPAGPLTFLFGIVAYTSPAWMALIALTAQSLQKNSDAVAALAKAQAEGLLDPPTEHAVADRVDATPLVLQIQQLVNSKDADLKLQAIQRHVSEPSPNWEDLHKLISDPDVRVVLVLARKIAAADYVKQTPQGTVTLAEIARWLALSAECAAGSSDPETAWSDLEYALRCVCLRIETISPTDPLYTEAFLPDALRAMEDVLRRLSPSENEIARLKDLVSAGRLAQPILARRLSLEIGLVKLITENEISRASRVGFPLKLVVASDVERRRAHLLSDIRELKRRFQLACSDPNASEEVIFGGPKDNFAGTDNITLTRLRLAKTALAMENYRLAHGTLPAALSELDSLSNEQRNTIGWDRQASQLEAKRFGGGFKTSKSTKQLLASTSAIEAGDNDENPPSDRYSPYIWNIRP